MKESFTDWSRIIITLILVVLVGWWLVKVGSNLSTTATRDSDGTVTDPFQRSKDILLTLLPLLTIALGYWFGAAGRQKAEEKADVAQQQLGAVLNSSSEPQLLQKAMHDYPAAFPGVGTAP
ncbi:hypothetical protein [Rhodococcus ruber]|uniref:hypothetical protein n=1 Tax=Rhodococcus ruber TaxID=1830 RepID=UPI00265E286F|nr:hypothetical protein [Rhodococcus ruber]MDO1481593.1 hypothetical protein [Rhodococcus ruber]